MKVKTIFKNKIKRQYFFSIMLGTITGIVSIYICLTFNLQIYGFNIDLIISPLLAGFVETSVSKELTGETTGAVSSIILFLITNIIGWLFPAQPIVWNIFTYGGIAVMLQAAFPLVIDYILFALFLVFIYFLGLIGEKLAFILQKFTGKNMVDYEVLPGECEDFQILTLTNKPNLPILKYHEIVSSEMIVRFDNKNRKEKLDYMGANLNEQKTIKELDYQIAQKYVLHEIKKQAMDKGANAIIDINIEHTNLNERLPPDVLVFAYGTAVTLNFKKNEVM